MKTKLIAGIALGSLFVAGVAAAQVFRGAYDEPAHKVVIEDGRFEVRAYEPRVVAETTVDTTDWQRATSTGFGRLADFIFGENRTADGESQKIAMTTPVESAPGNDQVVVVFTMPPEHDLESLAEPVDERVNLRRVPAETVATLRFSGSARTKDISALRSQLFEAMERHGFEPAGTIRIAQYDPPWTPGFLRRNEVMVRVRPKAD